VTLFLDACIIIYWIEAPDPFHARLMARLRALRRQAPDAGFAVSRLSWMECLVKPMRDNDQALMDEYRVFFDAGQLQVIELSAPVIERATSLRAKHGLRTPDALQAASALEITGDILFLTNDERRVQAGSWATGRDSQVTQYQDSGRHDKKGHAMELKPIRTKTEYKAALKEAEAPWDAPDKKPRGRPAGSAHPADS
jgi:predicted nucleic acid-binding protein